MLQGSSIPSGKPASSWCLSMPETGARSLTLALDGELYISDTSTHTHALTHAKISLFILFQIILRTLQGWDTF